ncbi:MAG TPA: polyphenol oxidase family protein [Verrucomicrobiales bacterium]|nr:polyphenol oxidase family protein [Verrucomicrobiales bacterium]
MRTAVPGLECFPALSRTGVAGLDHAFVLRVAGVAVDAEKAEVMERLAPFHRRAVEALGWPVSRLATAEQVHGVELALVGEDVGKGSGPIGGADGLLTGAAGVLLGIVVADCCAVYVVDSRTKALGLLHAGRRGTEAGILSRAVESMQAGFGSQPEDLWVQLSPCIRPPAYEADIPAMLKRQAWEAGIPVERVIDCGVCTSSDPARYYSYRREGGRTGRMLALLGRRKQTGNDD